MGKPELEDQPGISTPFEPNRLAVLETQVASLSHRMDLLLERLGVTSDHAASQVEQQRSTLEPDLSTTARFLKAWHDLSASRKVIIYGRISSTLPTPEVLVGKESFSVPEISLAWGKSPERVRALIKEGRLPADRDYRNRYRVSRSDLEAFQPKPAGRPPKLPTT